MKDLMIKWVEEHKYEHEDGTWSWAQDGEVHPERTERYATEEELDEVLWNYIVDNAEECCPSPY